MSNEPDYWSVQADPEAISATVASRNFSRILDAVEGGRRFVVERRGHYICELGPPRPPARRLSESVAVIRGRAPVLLDDGFADDFHGCWRADSPSRRARREEYVESVLASTAIVRRDTIVTGNRRHFDRVAGLSVVDF
jgi:antitoxin (DNA-binding transcriptional repressor) of toxin-antitoxin stability system